MTPLVADYWIVNTPVEAEKSTVNVSPLASVSDDP
jgi:hypothetical protein